MIKYKILKLRVTAICKCIKHQKIVNILDFLFFFLFVSCHATSHYLIMSTCEFMTYLRNNNLGEV